MKKVLILIYCLIFITLIKANGYLLNFDAGHNKSVKNVNGSFAPPICVGQLSGAIGVPTTNCHKWIPEHGLIDPTSSITQASPARTTEYTLIISDTDGNIVQELTYVVEVVTIDAEIYPEEPVLCEASTVTLEAVTWGNNAGYSYLWSNGETTEAILAESAGIYSVTVTDALSGCTAEASTEVTQSEHSVTINPESTEVCIGSPIELEAMPSAPAGNYTYEWSNGENGPIISVDQPGTYIVTATGLSNGCESIAETTLESSNITVSIDPEQPVICPGGNTTLNLDGGVYQSIEWSTGETSNSIVVNNTGVYSVTVTSALGCIATATVEVMDASDPNAIKAFFEGKGFYSIDINILGPAIKPNDNGELKNLGQCEFCDPNNPDPCSGIGGNCVQDCAGYQIEMVGTTISTTELEGAIKSNFEYFTSEYGYMPGEAFLTKNENVCTCSEYLKNVETQFNNGDLVNWIHLWDSGILSTDKLFFLANVPSLSEHTPGQSGGWKDFMDMVLDAMGSDGGTGNLGSEAEQILFGLMDHSLDNHLNMTIGTSDESVPSSICGSFITDDASCMTPADIPIQMRPNTILRFEVAPQWGGIPPPPGSLTGFTQLGAGNNLNIYSGRTNAGGTGFAAYYEVTIKGALVSGNNGANPYISEPYPSVPWVTLGYKEDEDLFKTELREYTCTLPATLGKVMEL